MTDPEDVDRWFTDRLHPPDPGLDAARALARDGGLPDIAITAAQGKTLHLLARAAGARRILEIGTLGGYSAVWLARALPPDDAGATVVTCEIDPHHAEVARAVVDAAGVGDRVDIRVGPALDTLAALPGPFDVVFVDADKPNNARYVAAALDLARPGTLVVVDNVLRHGHTTDPAHAGDPDVVGVHDAVALVASDPRLDGTVLQTVGEKGWDGWLVAVVAG